MKFFSVVTVFVLGLLALANAIPLSPDPGNAVFLSDCDLEKAIWRIDSRP